MNRSTHPGRPARRRDRIATAIVFLVAPVFCAACSGRPGGSGISDAEAGSSNVGELAWVATAQQNGIVGYRDPVGVMSPDGALLAYAEGRDVRVVPLGGGSSRQMARADGQVRHLAWLGNRSILAEDRAGEVRWWVYDAQSGARAPLWDETSLVAAGSDREVTVDALASLAVSADASEGLRDAFLGICPRCVLAFSL